MAQKAALIQYEGVEFEALIFNIVDRAIKLNQSAIQAPPVNNSATSPLITSEQTKAITGWPDSTFRAKVRQMPEGIVIRKSKRLLLDRQKFLAWLTDGKGLVNG